MQYIILCRHASEHVHIQPSEWGKNMISDFDHGMIVHARRAGLSISVTADLWGFSHTQHSLLRMVQQFYRQKCLVDERGQQSMARVVRADRKATVTQITTLYNCGEQKSMHNTSNPGADGLQQQKTILGSSSVSQEQKAEATVGTGSTK